jgi:hypothetical protein
MGKKPTAPEGADLLYSRLIACEPRDSLVFVKVGSGEFEQSGMLTLRMAMEFHHRLGVAIDAMLQANVTRLDQVRADH